MKKNTYEPKWNEQIVFSELVNEITLTLWFVEAVSYNITMPVWGKSYENKSNCSKKNKKNKKKIRKQTNQNKQQHVIMSFPQQ